ncbi:hypothetical protein IWW39_004433 [Coemansia spiralis]|uniref:DUF7721 domain-containing protein n=1 Tax=Coemansia spiralis TaxID=417178 RepID=A0A9W8L2P4_9FUNG|nr:hypothetical protein IWW39_004433 [Coemansia spiralis]
MDFGKLASGLLSGNKKGDQSQDSGGGFDINQATSLASGFLGSKGGNQSTSGFDIGQASALASKFLGGNSTNNNDLFSSALKMATGNTGFNKGDADHDTIKDSYNKVNSGSDLKNKAEQTLGMASAYMAFQKFQGKGGSQNELVAMAMSQAQKMYASHSNNSGVNQQETLATAAQAAMKLFGSK